MCKALSNMHGGPWSMCISVRSPQNKLSQLLPWDLSLTHLACFHLSSAFKRARKMCANQLAMKERPPWDRMRLTRFQFREVFTGARTV